MQLEKVTKPAAGEGKRSYGDACGTAHGLELIGDRWALLVMRELLLGPRRFSDLRRDLPGISANVLTQRLEELEGRGLVRKVRLPPPAARDAYQATDWGLEIEPVIQELGRFAARSPQHNPTLPLSPVSLMLRFRTMFDAKKARGVVGLVGFRLGEETFVARVRKGRIRTARGAVEGSDAVITASPERIAGAVYAGFSMDGLQIEGDRELAARFLSLFTLPPKVEAVGGAS